VSDPALAKVLRLLGLGVRGRGAVVGVERVREAAAKGSLVLAVVAPDASRHSLEKVLPLLAAKRVGSSKDRAPRRWGTPSDGRPPPPSG